MYKPVVILGMGGHAKVCIEILKLLNIEMLGIVAPENNHQIKGVQYIGNDEAVLSYSAESIMLVNGVGHVPHSKQRSKIYEFFKHKHYEFMSLVHPSAIMASDVKIQAGAQIMAGVVIQPNTTIGENTIVNTATIIEHDSQVGSNVHLAPGVTLCGTSTIEQGVFIGANSVVVPNVTIGKDALVAAGSVVLENIAPGARFIQKKEGSYL
ncbi:MAG: acetyltransferase [Gammaproteobacteria bacterium]|nr:acetyltransferase [Gammaproteobacteria bacterium]